MAQGALIGIDAIDDTITDIERDANKDLARGTDAERFGPMGVVQGFRGSFALTGSAATGNSDTAEVSLGRTHQLRRQRVEPQLRHRRRIRRSLGRVERREVLCHLRGQPLLHAGVLRLSASAATSTTASPPTSMTPSLALAPATASSTRRRSHGACRVAPACATSQQASGCRDHRSRVPGLEPRLLCADRHGFADQRHRHPGLGRQHDRVATTSA